MLGEKEKMCQGYWGSDYEDEIKENGVDAKVNMVGIICIESIKDGPYDRWNPICHPLESN